MELFNLKGRVALVTGGNGGIGLGMARGLAQAGAALLIAGRNAAKNEQAVKELAGLGGDVASAVADVTAADAGRVLVKAAVERFGRLDILVNNAGINQRKAPQDYSLAEWHAILDANLTSAFVCSQAAFPEFKKLGGGKIVNIGSLTSVFGLSFSAAYSASKGGLAQLTKALATAWAADNIQVNAILPGWIDTDLTRRGRREVAGLNEQVLRRTPAKRWGTPDDFAGAAVFFASAASDFVTGSSLLIDGGYAAEGLGV